MGMKCLAYFENLEVSIDVGIAYERISDTRSTQLGQIETHTHKNAAQIFSYGCSSRCV